MINKEKMIGENIICPKMGIGEIVEITTLQSDGGEFYKVKFKKDRCINYFSINNQNNYRVISTKDNINKAIDIFKTKFELREYVSTQEKINSQKLQLKEKDICKLAQTLSILNSEKEIHLQINKPYNDTLNGFIDEIMFALSLNKIEVYSLLGLKEPKVSLK